MATGDKSDLLASLANNVTDNAAGENTPSRHRTYASQIITYCLNLAETVKQTVAGAIDFSEQVEFKKNPTYLGNPIYTGVPVAYCNFEMDTELQLTIASQIVTGWAPKSTPTGISTDGTVITLGYDGIYWLDIERIYKNTEANPAAIISVTIDVQYDDNSGAGFVSSFQRTMPISSATANNEPAILSFSTPSVFPAIAGTKLRVRFSAVDGVAEPTDTYLVLTRINANLIQNLPAV